MIAESEDPKISKLKVTFMHALMDAKVRDGTVKAFQEEPEADGKLAADIIILPARSFGKGHTLTRANREVLLDID